MDGGSYSGLSGVVNTLIVFAAIGAIAALGVGCWLVYWLVTHVRVI